MEKTQRIISVFTQETNLLIWIEAFLIDRKAQNLTKGSIEYYQEKLGIFIKYCDAQIVSDITEITPNFLRQFLIHLEEQGHNPGGVHGVYRSVKAFLRWYENEAEPENWNNPIKRIKSPKLPEKILNPVEIQDIFSMVETCKTNKFTDSRDKAILLFLLDSGVRSQEFINLNISDVNPYTGEITIEQGKGRKSRTIFIGKTTRKTLRRYLKSRYDNNPSLWITTNLDRFSYDGLRGVITRRAKLANINPVPSLHSFRRAAALALLRNGADIITIQRILGHSSLAVLKQYLKLNNDDLRIAYSKNSPVDRWRL